MKLVLLFAMMLMGVVTATPGYASFTGSSAGQISMLGGQVDIVGSGFSGYTTVQARLKTFRDWRAVTVHSDSSMEVSFSVDDLRNLDGSYTSGTSQNVYIKYDNTEYNCNGCITFLSAPTISSSRVQNYEGWFPCHGFQSLKKLYIDGANFPRADRIQSIQIVIPNTFPPVLWAVTDPYSVTQTRLIAYLPDSPGLDNQCLIFDVRVWWGDDCYTMYYTGPEQIKGCDDYTHSCNVFVRDRDYCGDCEP